MLSRFAECLIQLAFASKGGMKLNKFRARSLIEPTFLNTIQN